ncbi:MAG: phosphatase PAP2 family protein [Mycobacterium sp.]
MSRTSGVTGRAWLLACAAFIVYALLWLGYVQQWNWLARLDNAALDTAHDYGIAHPGWVSAWDVFCTVLGPGAFRLVVAVVVIVLLVRHQWLVAMFLIATVELSGLATEVAKLLAERPRPPTALVSAYGTSFPSGHSVGIVVCVLALLALFMPKAGPALRPWLGVFGVVLILAIGIGRVLLNVHHPSDVVAGWAFGYVYFVICLYVFPHRELSSGAETPPAPGT